MQKKKCKNKNTSRKNQSINQSMLKQQITADWRKDKWWKTMNEWHLYMFNEWKNIKMTINSGVWMLYKNTKHRSWMTYKPINTYTFPFLQTLQHGHWNPCPNLWTLFPHSRRKCKSERLVWAHTIFIGQTARREFFAVCAGIILQIGGTRGATKDSGAEEPCTLRACGGGLENYVS